MKAVGRRIGPRGGGGGSKKKKSDRSPQIAESERGCQGLLPGSEQGHCGFGASDSWLPKEYLESSELSLTRHRTLTLPPLAWHLLSGTVCFPQFSLL